MLTCTKVFYWCSMECDDLALFFVNEDRDHFFLIELEDTCFLLQKLIDSTRIQKLPGSSPKLCKPLQHNTMHMAFITAVEKSFGLETEGTSQALPNYLAAFCLIKKQWSMIRWED